MRHCGKQIAKMNQLKRKHYNHKKLPDNQALLDFMRDELWIHSDVLSIQNVDKSDWNIRIDTHHAMNNITKKH